MPRGNPALSSNLLTPESISSANLGSGIESGFRVVMYVSSPVKALVGEFTAGKVFVGSFEDVVRFVSSFPNPGVGEDDYSYVRGRKRRAMGYRDPEPY